MTDILQQGPQIPSMPPALGLGDEFVTSMHPESIPSDTSNKENTSPSLATRFSTQSINFAREMHRLRYIYALYGILDGEYLTYSSIKYFFDVLFAQQSSSQLMRDWLLTPTGFFVASLESLALISFAVIANSKHKSDKDISASTRTLLTLWPYFRHVISELKNASKGLRNSLKVASLFRGEDLNHLMMPLGLTLGVLSVLNRIWFQNMHDQRKEISKELSSLLKKVMDTNFENEAELQRYSADFRLLNEKLHSQLSYQHKYAYLSAVYSGLTEGALLYIGLLSFIPFTSPLFIPMAMLCSSFTLAHVVALIYEEYECQRSLEVDSLLIQLHLKQREIESLNVNMHAAMAANNHTDIDYFNKKYESIFKDLINLSKEFDARSVSTLNKALSGFTDGIVTYYSSITKVFLTICLLSSTVPPAFLIANVAIGVVLLTSFTANAIIKHYQESKNTVKDPIEKLLGEEDIFHKVNQALRALLPIHEAMDTKPASSFFRNWFDILCIFLIGLDKGRKLITNAIIMAFLALRLNNEFEDSPIMMRLTMLLGVLCSLIVSSILALRVHALSFGAKADNADAQQLNGSPEQLVIAKDVGQEAMVEGDSDSYAGIESALPVQEALEGDDVITVAIKRSSYFPRFFREDYSGPDEDYLATFSLSAAAPSA